MNIRKIDVETFDKFSSDYPYTNFQQTSNWAKLKAKVGWTSLYLGLFDNEQLIAAGLFLGRKLPIFNKYLYYCPHGLQIDYADSVLLKEALPLFINKLKEEKGFKLIMDPYYPYQERDINGDIVPDGFNHQETIDTLKGLGFIHSGFNIYFENLQPRFQFRLALDKDIKEIEDGFTYEAKRRIKKKDYLAINVRELTKEEIPTYKELMEMTSNRRGFIDRPLSYYEEMYECLNPLILHYYGAEIDFNKCYQNVTKDNEAINDRIAKLLLKPESIKRNNRIHEEEVVLEKNLKLIDLIKEAQKERGNKALLSVVCIMTYGNEMIMLLAGNDEKYLQHFNTSNIIVSELIKKAKEEGYKYYNFYGIAGDFNPHNELYGLYAYKKQYGGEVVELIGQFEYTLDSFVTNLYETGLTIYKKIRKR